MVWWDGGMEEGRKEGRKRKTMDGRMEAGVIILEYDG